MQKSRGVYCVAIPDLTWENGTIVDYILAFDVLQIDKKSEICQGHVGVERGVELSSKGVRITWNEDT